MRLVAALGVLLLANKFFPFSKALHRRLHISIFWKQDFTLKNKFKSGQKANLQNSCIKIYLADTESVPAVLTYCELWGKCSRCVMVTKGWFRVFMGVIRLSASSVSIFFSRSMNSRLSAFSARMSVPSRLVMFTCRETESHCFLTCKHWKGPRTVIPTSPSSPASYHPGS